MRYNLTMRAPKRFYVYIMTNGPKSTVLYVGITDDLRRRVWQHKNKLIEGFTSRYNITRLVYFETFVYPDAAINREKKLKGGDAARKSRSLNPGTRIGMTSPESGKTSTGQQAGPIAGRSLGPLVKARAFGMTPGSESNLI